MERQESEENGEILKKMHEKDMKYFTKKVFDELNSLPEEELKKELNKIKTSHFGEILLESGAGYLNCISVNKKNE